MKHAYFLFLKIEFITCGLVDYADGVYFLWPRGHRLQNGVEGVFCLCFLISTFQQCIFPFPTPQN